MSAFKPAAVVPTYNNAKTVGRVVESLRRFLPEVIVVDDGSAAETRAVVEDLGQRGLARAVHRQINGGKGAAVKTGLSLARELGFTHLLQVDADGQHDLDDVPRFLDAARGDPRALVLGCPIFDGSVNRGRLIARQITIFWTHLETGGRRIVDPMCGFRVYPLDAEVWSSCGNRMDFDIEIAVRLAWRGRPIINLPTKVRYLDRSEGGLSSFRLVEDNLRISWAHTRLVFEAIWRVLTWPFRRRA